MNILHPVHPEDFKQYDTALIRRRFLVDDLMQPGLLQFTYTPFLRRDSLHLVKHLILKRSTSQRIRSLFLTQLSHPSN